MHVRQMHFDERDADSEQRIAQGDARVRERTRIEYDVADALALRSMDAIDQHMLRVALQAIERMASRLCQLGEARVDVGKRVAAVDLGLARAEQIEIRAVQDE